MDIVKSEQAKSLTLERMTIILQNVNSGIYRLWLITRFARLYHLQNLVERCRAANWRRTTDVLPGATYVGLPYTTQIFFRERRTSVSSPSRKTAHRMRLPRPLRHSWVLNVDSYRTNDGYLFEILSFIFDNARHTAQQPYLCTTIHTSQRLGAWKKITRKYKIQ